MTGLPDAGTDPAAELLAACDLREKRIDAATDGTWEAFCPGSEGWEVREVVPPTVRRRRRVIAKLRYGAFEQDRADAQHIAAEANPDHARAEVALWRQIAEDYAADDDRGAFGSVMDFAVGAARAYLTGAGG